MAKKIVGFSSCKYQLVRLTHPPPLALLWVSAV